MSKAQKMISSVEAWQYAIALQPPAPVAERRGIILRWQLEDARSIFSEMAPLPGFSPETLAECRQACQAWLGNDPAVRIVDNIAPVSLEPLPAAARFAIEAGRLQLLYELPPVAPIQLCSLIDPSLQNESVGWDPATSGLPAEMSCLKVKVGRQSVAADMADLSLLDNHLPGHVKLRLDANRAWSLAQAQQVCNAIPAQRIDYVEEPLVPESSYADWANAVDVPFAWDETLRENPAVNLLTPGLAALVVKPMLTGLAQTQAWLQAANSAQRRVVLSAAFESNLTLDLYARLSAFWGLRGHQGLDTFSAWPVSLLEPLRSQPGHAHKPLVNKDKLSYLGRWLG